MNPVGRFVLHPETVLEAGRPGPDGPEYIVGRRGTRGVARGIQPSLFRLLDRFRSPTTILDGVIEHAMAEGEPPESVLEEAWPALWRLIGAGVLVDGDKEWDALVPRLQIGDVRSGARVVECLTVMEDFQVYRAMRDDGVQVAIKLASAKQRGAVDLLRREACLLEELGGQVTPDLVEMLEEEPGPALVSRWCAGTTLAQWLKGDRPDRLALASCIAKAYSTLHAAGVLHVDVNLNNIMVAPRADGGFDVRLIDFAGAVRIDESPRIGRLGVLGFQEPEYLAAVAERQRAPEASLAGEQYSIGCVLYHVLTGSPPVPLDADRKVAASDIVGKPIRRFAEHGIFDFNAVEAVVLRAMSREPGERFSSVGELSDALDAGIAATPVAARRLGGVADTLIRALSPGGDWYDEAFPGSPRCSVNAGSGGVALALLELALQREDDRLLRLADEWLAKTREWGRRDGYASERYPKFAELVADGISLLHTETGTLWLDALFHEALGRAEARDKAVERLGIHTQRTFSNFDLALGRTGDLAAAASILGRTGSGAVRGLGDPLATEITAFSSAFGPIDRSRGVEFNLGMAHGWAGEIWAMAMWARATGEPPAAWVIDRAAELLAHARVGRGGALAWPWWSPKKDTHVHSWCNGNAGFVLAYCELARASRDDQWIRVAERAGMDLARTRWGAAHLCCGAAGGAYVRMSTPDPSTTPDNLAAA